MSNEKEKIAAAIAAPPSPFIPVRSLRFRDPVDIPGQPTASGVSGVNPDSPLPNTRCWRIYFDPRLRHHRVEFYDVGRDAERKASAVRYVPESWATWDPA